MLKFLKTFMSQLKIKWVLHRKQDIKNATSILLILAANVK